MWQNHFDVVKIQWYLGQIIDNKAQQVQKMYKSALNVYTNLTKNAKNCIWGAQSDSVGQGLSKNIWYSGALVFEVDEKWIR